MINVLKRLAELDAQNPNIVKENADLAECGMMPEMGMSMERPSTPASINMTAGSGEELSDMLATIMQLAGVHKVGDEHMGGETPPAVISMEPAMTAGDSMRSVIDKMHGDGDEEADEGIASMAGQALGSVAGTALGGPVGGAVGGALGNAAGSALSGDEETDEGQYDNSPADPKNAPEFDAEEFAHHENQPGGGNDSNGKKRQSNMPTATFESLMKEYKQFINEAEEEEMDEAAEEEELEEGTCSTCHKDPCGCENTEESATESLDILRLAGLK